MNEIQFFDSTEFGSIRVVEEDGKFLFCGSDVAKALGYSRPNEAVSTHCKGTVKRRTPTTSGVQEMLFIPEGDVYRLISRSKLPAAERFEVWVFDEILPSIRKYGGYMAGQEELTDAELLANAMLVANRVIEDRERQIKELMEENKELEEDANYTRTILRNPGLVTTNQIAKDYGMSARTFNKLLHSMGIQYKQGKQWLLYSPYQSKGYTASKTYDFTHKNGRKDVGMLTMWTQRGRAFLYSALKDEGIVPEIEKVDLFD